MPFKTHYSSILEFPIRNIKQKVKVTTKNKVQWLYFRMFQINIRGCYIHYFTGKRKQLWNVNYMIYEACFLLLSFEVWIFYKTSTSKECYTNKLFYLLGHDFKFFNVTTLKENTFCFEEFLVNCKSMRTWMSCYFISVNFY